MLFYNMAILNAWRYEYDEVLANRLSLEEFNIESKRRTFYLESSLFPEAW